jgi:hypothetical protein
MRYNDYDVMLSFGGSHRQQTAGEDFPGEFDEGSDRSRGIVRVHTPEEDRRTPYNHEINKD